MNKANLNKKVTNKEMELVGVLMETIKNQKEKNDRKNERIVELEDRIFKLQLMCREHNTPIPATKRNVPSSCTECDGAGNFKTNDDEWESCDAGDGDGRLK